MQRLLAVGLLVILGGCALVVDDLVDQGDTLETVRKHLGEHKPMMLEAAVLFKKPWSRVEPDYYLEVTDRWVVFPFELSEVNRLTGEKETKGER